MTLSPEAKAASEACHRNLFDAPAVDSEPGKGSTFWALPPINKEG